ncbi:MAG: PilZ domain-containing protein [Desulfosalsimonas sp.]
MEEARKVKREIMVSPLEAELVGAVLRLSPEQQRELLAELKSSRASARRKFSRRPYREVVQFTAKGKLFNGFFKNVSDSGAYVETMKSDLHHLGPGEKVIMSFEHPYNNRYIKRTGEIARTGPDGIGVQFHNLL